MPKTAVDYSKTIIYKIVCKDTTVNDCYVGHTTHFVNRRNVHKTDYSRFPDRKLYHFMDTNGGWDNFDMIEIETLDCKNNTEAKMRERYWCEHLNSTLNSYTPLYIDSNGISTDSITHEDKRLENVLKTKFRRNAQTKLLIQLQKENKELKSKVDELTKLLHN